MTRAKQLDNFKLKNVVEVSEIYASWGLINIVTYDAETLSSKTWLGQKKLNKCPGPGQDSLETPKITSLNTWVRLRLGSLLCVQWNIKITRGKRGSVD